MKRILLASVFSVLVATTSGCGEDCGEPAYEGGTQDEAFRAMVDAEKGTRVGDPNAVTLLEPTAGQTFAATASPPTFRWSSPIRAAATPVRHSGPRRNLWDRVRSLVISDAYAHGAPYTGDLYDVRVEVPGQTCPVRILTGNATWIPSADDWAKIVEGPAGKRVVTIVSAYMRDNRVTEGPFAPGEELSFEVGER